MRRQRRRVRRGLPLDRTMRPDTVLLRRELRWTAATMAGLGAAGYAIEGPYGAAIWCGAGFLLQQAGYRLAVRTLWHGWRNRAIACDGVEKMRDLGQVWLRAFTLWMRTASARERLYLAGWTGVDEDAGEDQQVDAESTAEVRIRQAYDLVARLEDQPLWCDNVKRRRLRRSLQRDERHLLGLATESG